MRTKRIAQEASFAIVEIAPEELGPIAIRAVAVFEAFFTSRLDFELP
jgi:hypothetical protein